MTSRPRETSDADLSRDARTREFVLWVLRAQGLQTNSQGDGVYNLHIPEDWRKALGDVEQLSFVCRMPTRNDGDEASAGGLHYMAPGTALFQQALARLNPPGRVIHASPRNQPTKVHELTTQLLGAYQFDGGQIHLGGCTLEDRPVIRTTYLDSASPPGDRGVRHVYSWPDGNLVDMEAVSALRLEHLGSLTNRRPLVSDNQALRWLDAARNCSLTTGTEATGMLVQCVIWCKFAEGKIVFAARGRTADVRFASWAQWLTDGRQKPPPFRCPACGKESYRLVTTDTGHITVAEGVADCQQSGRLVLETELEQCPVSGRRVLSQFMDTCPLSGERLETTSLMICDMCQQRVSPSTLKGDRCTACRRLHRIPKDDVRLARVLGEYPGLDRWSRWRFSETSRVYVLLGKTMWRRLLVVVDKQTLEVHHMAAAGRFLPVWRQIPTPLRDKYLG